MFGQPDYFRTQQCRLPVPRNSAGWMFYVLWSLAILGPTFGLLWMGKSIEVVIWLLISGVWFSMDLFATRRKVHRQAELDQLFYVGEEDSHVSTQNYDLNLRQSQDPQ